MRFKRLKDLREDNDKKQQDLADYLNIKQPPYVGLDFDFKPYNFEN